MEWKGEEAHQQRTVGAREPEGGWAAHSPSGSSCLLCGAPPLTLKGSAGRRCPKTCAATGLGQACSPLPVLPALPAAACRLAVPALPSASPFAPGLLRPREPRPRCCFHSLSIVGCGLLTPCAGPRPCTTAGLLLASHATYWVLLLLPCMVMLAATR